VDKFNNLLFLASAMNDQTHGTAPHGLGRAAGERASGRAGKASRQSKPAKQAGKASRQSKPAWAAGTGVPSDMESQCRDAEGDANGEMRMPSDVPIGRLGESFLGGCLDEC
jgi:hypothetical protein